MCDIKVCVCLCVLQISSIRLRFRRPPVWKRGGTLLIWVRAPRLQSALGFVQSNVSEAPQPHPPCSLVCRNTTYLYLLFASRRTRGGGFNVFHRSCSRLLSSPDAPSCSLSPTLPSMVCLSHTPFSLPYSPFQSKYCLTSSHQLGTFPPPPVCRHFGSAGEGAVQLRVF